jgi:DNA-directed RNA polymerase subunit N (RpoN/RPB10)
VNKKILELSLSVDQDYLEVGGHPITGVRNNITGMMTIINDPEFIEEVFDDLFEKYGCYQRNVEHSTWNSDLMHTENTVISFTCAHVDSDIYDYIMNLEHKIEKNKLLDEIDKL